MEEERKRSVSVLMPLTTGPRCRTACDQAPTRAKSSRLFRVLVRRDIDTTKHSFFFPSVLIGPSLEYSTYDALVLGKLYDTPPPGVQDSQHNRRIPHGRKRVAYLHLLIGLAFLGGYSVYGGQASYSRILTPTWYTWSWITRLGFINLAGFVARTKYYAVWSMSEVSQYSIQLKTGRLHPHRSRVQRI